jgi:hypothetical protein
MPGVAAATATLRLRVGEIDGALGSAVRGGFEQQGVGGVGRGEVVQACGKTGAHQRGSKCDRIQLFARTHICILTLMAILLKDADHVGWGAFMPVELSVPLAHQFVLLLMIAIARSLRCVDGHARRSFREPREFCKRMSQDCKALPQRKFFYLFTCEYCFSHYVSALALWLFRFQLLYEGWRGYWWRGSPWCGLRTST